MSKNTKNDDPRPVIANAGERINLKQILLPMQKSSPSAVGFDKPPYLSINASNELVIGSGTDQTVLVKTRRYQSHRLQ